MHRLNEMQKLRDTRTEITTKSDDSVRDLTTMLQACEDASNSTCIVRFEQAHAITAAQLATLLAVLTTTANMPLTNGVAREIDMRSSKKRNLMLSGIRPSPTASDSDNVEGLLYDSVKGLLRDIVKGLSHD